LVNPEPITHNEILEMYRSIVKPTHSWLNMSVEEQNSKLKAQRSNTYLNSDKLLKDYPNIPTAKDAIYNIFKSFKHM